MTDWLTIGQSFPSSRPSNDKLKRKRDKKQVAKLAPSEIQIDAALKELNNLKKVKAVEAEAEAMSKDFRKVLITSGDTQFELWTNRVKNNDLLRFGLMASDVKSFKRLTK